MKQKLYEYVSSQLMDRYTKLSDTVYTPNLRNKAMYDHIALKSVLTEKMPQNSFLRHFLDYG